jgi:hypothetical protein
MFNRLLKLTIKIYLWPSPTIPANKKQKSIFKSTQFKTDKKSSKSSAGTQLNSRRSHLKRACNTRKHNENI